MFNKRANSVRSRDYTVVIRAQMLEDGTLRLRIDDSDKGDTFGSTMVKPDPGGALSDSRVGKAFLQLCVVPLMARPRFLIRA